MYRIVLIVTLGITLAGFVGCEPADSKASSKSATNAAAKPQPRPEPISWELEPIAGLPDEIKGIWKGDVHTARQKLLLSMNYGDAQEYAKHVLLDIYPYNVHFTGLMGDKESVVISSWHVTPNEVYVGEGKTKDRRGNEYARTVYMRIKAGRLEIDILSGDMKPDWKDAYTLVRG